MSSEPWPLARVRPFPWITILGAVAGFIFIWTPAYRMQVSCIVLAIDVGFALAMLRDGIRQWHRSRKLVLSSALVAGLVTLVYGWQWETGGSGVELFPEFVLLATVVFLHTFPATRTGALAAREMGFALFRWYPRHPRRLAGRQGWVTLLIVVLLFAVAYNAWWLQRHLPWYRAAGVSGLCFGVLRRFPRYLVPAASEELFFRAGLQNWLAWKMKPRGLSYHHAIVLSAILFALPHALAEHNAANLSGFFYRLAFGIVMGNPARRWGLEASILAHTGSNALYYTLRALRFAR